MKEQQSNQNKGFELKCLNCGSTNVNIDFEDDVFWCGDCVNTIGCLDHGQKINDPSRLQSSNDRHKSL